MESVALEGVRFRSGNAHEGCGVLGGKLLRADQHYSSKSTNDTQR